MNQREKQKLETRRKIYNSAFYLFGRRSFESVKITEIAKYAGVSVGSFYYHFTTKESLIDEGYRKFDEKLKAQYNRDEPQPGIEGVKYLISGQLEDVKDKGHEITGIFFKNQIGTSNNYLFTKDRFLYSMLLKNISLINKTGHSDIEISDTILRNSRGTVYDWCLHKGTFDIVTVGMEGLDIVLSYYDLL